MCPGTANTRGVLWLVQCCLTSSAAFEGLRGAWQVISISSQPSFRGSWSVLWMGSAAWSRNRSESSFTSTRCLGVWLPLVLSIMVKLRQWASSPHVRPSCACAQRDLMEFVSKSYQKLINPIVLKTEEMLHFVLIYFYVLSIPNICFTMV